MVNKNNPIRLKVVEPTRVGVKVSGTNAASFAFDKREIINGISPVVTLTENEEGVLISVQDIQGPKEAQVLNGHTPVKGFDYMTEEDLDEIAERVPAPEKLRTARTIELTGEAAGQALFDGSEDVQIYTAIAVLTNEEIEQMLT